MQVVKTGLCVCLIDVYLNGNIISRHQTWYIDSMYSNDYLIQILGNSDLWKVSNLRNHHIVVKTTWWLLTVSYIVQNMEYLFVQVCEVLCESLVKLATSWFQC